MAALQKGVDRALDGRLLLRILLSGPAYAPPTPLNGFNPTYTHPVERRNPIILPVDNKWSSSIPDTILYWLLYKITGIIRIRNPPLKWQNLIRLIDIQSMMHKPWCLGCWFVTTGIEQSSEWSLRVYRNKPYVPSISGYLPAQSISQGTYCDFLPCSTGWPHRSFRRSRCISMLQMTLRNHNTSRNTSCLCILDNSWYFPLWFIAFGVWIWIFEGITANVPIPYQVVYPVFAY